MTVRDSVRAGLAARRCVLALSALVGWGNLAFMLWLSDGTPASELGRGAQFAPLFRRALPLLGLAMAASAVALTRRRTQAAGAASAFVILWLCDFVVRRPGFEHGHIFCMAALLTYAAVCYSRGIDRPSERTAWEACCAVVAAGYTLTAVAKLRGSSFEWVGAHHLQILTMSSLAQAHGWDVGFRLWLADSPWLTWFGGVYTLVVESLGPLMLFRRWRPYYMVAVLGMHAAIYVGMSSFWPSHYLVVVAVAFPFEAAFIRARAWGRHSYIAWALPLN